MKGDGDICRDYLRNVCNRGKKCKYYHPDEPQDVETDQNSLSKNSDVVFCHDYQNNGCNRPSCKYTHCTREEQEFYAVSAQLPPRIQRNLSMGLGPGNDDMMVSQGDVPVCKDYLKGTCDRGNRCKYRHVNNQYEEFAPPPHPLDMMESRYERSSRMRDRYNGRPEMYDYDDGMYDFEQNRVKRRRMDVDENWRMNLLDEENIMLRHKIEALKQQVDDLKATNEVLLDQNARYRIEKMPLRMSQSVTSSAASAMGNDHMRLSASGMNAMSSSGMNPVNPVSIVPVSHPQSNMAVAASMAQTMSGMIAYPRLAVSSMPL